MDDTGAITWNVTENTPKKKSVDWFWAISVIAFSLAVILFVFGNVFLGIFVIIATATIILMSLKKPHTASYRLNEDGLFENDTFFSFKDIRSFYIDEVSYEVPTLLVDIKRWFLPVIAIPLPNNFSPETIRSVFRRHVIERELKEPMTHYLLDIFDL